MMQLMGRVRRFQVIFLPGGYRRVEMVDVQEETHTRECLCLSYPKRARERERGSMRCCRSRWQAVTGACLVKCSSTRDSHSTEATRGLRPQTANAIATPLFSFSLSLLYLSLSLSRSLRLGHEEKNNFTHTWISK